MGGAVGAAAIMRVEVDALCATGRFKRGAIGVTKAVATDVKTAKNANARAEKRAIVYSLFACPLKILLECVARGGSKMVRW